MKSTSYLTRGLRLAIRMILSSGFIVGVVSAPAAASSISITEYPIPDADIIDSGIALGPDGNIWFTEHDADKVGKISLTGKITEYPGCGADYPPGAIAGGPDGNIWFATERRSFDDASEVNEICKISPDGVVTKFNLDNRDAALRITAGSDGNLWFTRELLYDIYRTTPSGKLSSIRATGRTEESYAQAISSGPDGNIWYTDVANCHASTCNGYVGRINLQTGQVTEYPVPTKIAGLEGIVGGPDGNVWFTERVVDEFDQPLISKIGKITPDGTITEYPFAAGHSPSSITKGPDGNLWFVDWGTLGEITPAGVITEYSNVGAIAVVNGSDGALWFTTGQSIGKAVISSSPTINSGYTGSWYDPSQSGHGFSIEVLPNNLMAAFWYVFAPNGGETWIAATGPITGNTAVLTAYQGAGPGGRFPPNFDPSQVKNQPWGTLTFSFSDCKNGQVNWQPTASGYTAGSLPIKRLTIPLGLDCE